LFQYEESGPFELIINNNYLQVLTVINTDDYRVTESQRYCRWQGRCLAKKNKNNNKSFQC